MAHEKMTDLVGWAVMHHYFRIDRARWRSFDDGTRRDAIAEFSDRLAQCAGEEGLQLVPMAGVAKSDFAFMAVHPDLQRLQRLGQEITATAFGTCLVPVYAFLSMSEVSEYMSTAADWARHLIDDEKMDPASPEFAKSVAGFEKRMAAYAEARVHPQIPADMPIVCFYPMSKARDEQRNWYTLPFDERKKLMGGHADTGRRFAGRILQLITSSTGIDDWEWGVTLFARDLKSVRDVVYEMRFDAGSAVYGQFGEFYMALRFAPAALADTLRL
jgi:hydrogen peroxide-dependent heme synthase